LFIVSGTYPFVFHLFQVILHGINAVLVYILFRKFFKDKLALIASLLFLVHPINQEAVAYISDLQEGLFFFFGMSAVLFSIGKINKIKKILLINTFVLLGLLSKETALLFIPMVLLYSYFFNKKKPSITFYIALVSTTAVYLYLRLFVAHISKINEALMPIMNASLYERLLTIPSIIFYYVSTFFFPYHLALGHAWVITSPSISQFYIPLTVDILFFILIGVLGVFVKRKNTSEFSVFIFFLIWFILGLLMHMQLVPLDATVADRWFYFPIVGLIGLVFVGVSSLCSIKKVRPDVITSIAIMIVLILAGRTMVRNANWVDNLTLCQHDLPYVPESYNVQSACGSQFIKAGQFEEAKKHLGIATQLAPKYGFSWYQYGLSYEYTHDIPKAREYYYKSITLSNEVNAYVSLAATYLKYDNNPQQAKKIIEQGLKSYPNYQRLQLYLAVCEYKLNNKHHALEIATKAYHRAPNTESQYVLTQITNDQEVILQ
jgi:4-amino-4-deoxy-L-arabinose transferase-like glycosyltransferase